MWTRPPKRPNVTVRARRIGIDINPTHGQQQLTFVNGHYATWCYLPLAAFVTFDGERNQQLIG